MGSEIQPANAMAGKTVGNGLVLDGNGKPTNLTPAVHEAIIADMQSHADWPAMTAYRCGVSPTTLERWVATGADPYAVEPYRSFVAEFVAAEAVVHGRLIAVILDAALGQGEPEMPFDPEDPMPRKPRPKPEWAAWLLQKRWGFLWNVSKETGKTNGVTVAEVVELSINKFTAERREKARGIIAKLSSEARAEARKEGFLL